jgi:hypothetical protein
MAAISETNRRTQSPLAANSAPVAQNPVTTGTSLERRLQRYHHGLQYGAGGESATPEGERRPGPMLPIEAPV